MLKKINNQLFFFIIPLILGIISSFSLPPYNFFILNFLTFPCLFIFIISNFHLSKWRFFLIGWIFGFGYFISNTYWIINSLTFEEIFLPLIPFAFFLLPLFLGLFYGLITFIFSFFNLEKNYRSILIFAFIFSLVEFVRGNILGGFPWNLIAYSWLEHTSFIQILSIIGVYSFNLLSITLFLLPAIVFFNRSQFSKILVLVFSIISIGANIYFGKNMINKYHKAQFIDLNTNIKVIAPKVKLNRFFQKEDPNIIINELIELSKPEKTKKTLFIFPEGILTNIYLEDLNIYKENFKNNFSENHKFIFGINSQSDLKIYNSLVVLDNNLNTLANYKKNNLVPFGEFLPLENMFSKFDLKKITQGYQSFSSDDNRKIIEISNIKFLPLICYEIIYSGKLNKSGEKFDFILNISEDGWFGNSIGPYQHFSHSIFRSIEEGKNLVRSANNGISAHINPIGQIVKKVESTEKGTFEIKNFKKISRTIFSQHGNKIFFYFLLFYISLIFFLKKKGS